MLEVKNLVKAYKNQTVVDGVSLTIKEGEVIGLLGPNGAGKTTTFYMLVGAIRADDGQCCLNQDDITALPMYKRARKGIGYLPQEASVFLKMTVEDNIKSMWQLRKVYPKEEQSNILDQILEELSISSLRHNLGYQLSGGEKRRVEIARALAMNPRYILLDEPFAGVDPIAVTQIQKIILMLKKRGIGVLITDHNVKETLKITDRSYIIYKGKILLEGSSEDIPSSQLARKLYLGDT